MTTGALVFASISAAFGYLAFIIILTGKVQDWLAPRTDHEVPLTFFFLMVMLFAVPISIAAGITG